MSDQPPQAPTADEAQMAAALREAYEQGREDGIKQGWDLALGWAYPAPV